MQNSRCTQNGNKFTEFLRIAGSFFVLLFRSRFGFNSKTFPINFISSWPWWPKQWEIKRWTFMQSHLTKADLKYREVVVLLKHRQTQASFPRVLSFRRQKVLISRSHDNLCWIYRFAFELMDNEILQSSSSWRKQEENYVTLPFQLEWRT